MRAVLAMAVIGCGNTGAPSPSGGSGSAGVGANGVGASGGAGVGANGVGASGGAGVGANGAGVGADGVGAKGGVQLVAPGAEPRVVLRHRLVAGTVTTLAVEVAMERSGPTGDGSVPVLAATLEMTVESVAGDGAARVKTVVKRAGSKGDTVAAQAALIEGAVVTATVMPDGATREVAVKLAARDAPSDLGEVALRQLSVLERMALRLPAEPIGVGGSWRYVVTDSPTGVPVRAETTVTVKAIDGARITYELATAITGDDHHIQSDGMDLTVSKLRGSGTGSGTFDLTTWAQTSTLSQSLAFDMAAAGETASASMKQTIRITQGEQSAP